ncbi:phage terminase small subunit P27 family [Niveispirillum cyanobacteriorum]|nr:phage terminase small subunit P27 family [Niveispirillum cyanobacteriorum]GGE85429.1 hypothetical protein GCM10011317_48270 [Niveispirillum cyanobacteriorum]
MKQLAGTAQPCRMNPLAPRPEEGIPLPPDWISTKARDVWNYVAPLLEQMGVLTEADGVALEGYCEAYADARAARESLSLPLILRSKNPATGEQEELVLAEAGERYYWTFGKGGPMRRARPELADIADADRRVAMWSAKFGNNPADRSRVAGGAPDDRNPFDDF